MCEREKIDEAVGELVTRGVSKAKAAPPFHRLLWAIGVNVPPPHFQRFLSLFGLFSLPFGILLALVLVLLLQVTGDQRPGRIGEHARVGITIGAIGGLAFGLMMAGSYKFSAWRLGLPRWAEFRPLEPESESEPDW